MLGEFQFLEPTDAAKNWSAVLRGAGPVRRLSPSFVAKISK